MNLKLLLAKNDLTLNLLNYRSGAIWMIQTDLFGLQTHPLIESLVACLVSWLTY
jgi:hypothetical protein